MEPQFITNNKGEKTTAIIQISEYEDLLHKRHLTLEVTNVYKAMIDEMLADEESGKAEYVSLETIKAKFSKD